MSSLPPYEYHSQHGEDAKPTAAASYNDYQPRDPYQPSDPYLQPQPQSEGSQEGYSPVPFSGQYVTSDTPLYQQQGPYQTPVYAQIGYGVPAESGRGMAIAGLVMGILSIFSAFLPFVGLVFPILGIVFSILGRKSLSLRAVATIGLILSVVGVVFSFIMIYVYYYIGTHPTSR